MPANRPVLGLAAVPVHGRDQAKIKRALLGAADGRFTATLRSIAGTRLGLRVGATGVESTFGTTHRDSRKKHLNGRPTEGRGVVAWGRFAPNGNQPVSVERTVLG